MNRSLAQSVICSLFVLFLTNTLLSQDLCGTLMPPPPLLIATQTGGDNIPSIGQINAIMLFIDYPDDVDDPGNINWPIGGVGPTYINDVIDLTPSQMSGKKYNITTYFRDMSFGQLVIYGHPIYRQAPKPLWRYINNTKNDGSPEPVNQSGNIPYYTVKDVLQQLDGTWDFSEFDQWKRVLTSQGNVTHENWSVPQSVDRKSHKFKKRREQCPNEANITAQS